MKKYSLSLLAGALMAFSACTNQEIPLDPVVDESTTPEGVIFTAQKFLPANGTQSRTLITPYEDGATFAWAEGDSIAIVPDEGAQIYFVINEIDAQNADKAVFTGGAWGLKTENEYAAYYPFIPDYSINQTNVPVDYSVQTYKPNVGGSITPSHDYMVARSVKQDGGNLKFDFTHLGALVEVKFALPEAAQVKQLRLSADNAIFPVKGSFCPADETPVFAPDNDKLSNEVIVKVEEVEANADEPVSVFFMMPPIATEGFNTNQLIAYVTCGENNVEIPFIITNSYTELRSNTYYTLTPELSVYNPTADELRNLIKPSPTVYTQQIKVRFVVGSTKNGKEINQDWTEIHTTAKKIFLPENSSRLFEHYTWFEIQGSNGYLTEIDLSNVSAEKVTDMSYMFNNNTYLTNITFGESFNTANVTDMSYMFDNCQSLSSLDLSSFNTANVTDMSYMFDNCHSLSSLDLSSFNTANVTDMNYMFYNCNKLSNLNLSSFNTSNVTDMSHMFRSCNSLSTLDLSSFNTANVTDMNYMFYNCNKLSNLNLSSFNTSNVTDMSHMFQSCNSLITLDLNSFNAANVTDMSYMFNDCSNLYCINGLNNFNTEKVSNIDSMFQGCSKLDVLDLSGFNTTNITDLTTLFEDCASLTSINWGNNFKTNAVTNMSSMFKGCSRLESLDLSHFNVEKVTDMSSMFENCTSLTTFTFGDNFFPASINDMSSLFKGCSSLVSVNLNQLKNVNSLVNYIWYIKVNSMFEGCSSLTTLDIRHFDSLKTKDFDCMFKDCYKLQELYLNSFTFGCWDKLGDITPKVPSLFLNLGKYVDGKAKIYIYNEDIYDIFNEQGLNIINYLKTDLTTGIDYNKVDIIGVNAE